MRKTKAHEEEVKTLGRSNQAHTDLESLWQLLWVHHNKGPCSASATSNEFLSSANGRKSPNKQLLNGSLSTCASDTKTPESKQINTGHKQFIKRRLIHFIHQKKSTDSKHLHRAQGTRQCHKCFMRLPQSIHLTFEIYLFNCELSNNQEW